MNSTGASMSVDAKPSRHAWYAGPGRRYRLAAFSVIALVVAGIAVYRGQRQGEATPQYVTAPIERGTVAPSVISSGTVNPVTTIQVGTYVSGVIQSISCDFNTQVKAGQLCAKIDPRPYQSMVEQETAALGTARAQLLKDRTNLSYAKLIRNRNADLLKRGIVSQETADTSDNAYNQAKAQIALDEATVAQHEAQLKTARINLGYTDITSPVNGTVVSRNVTQGQTVAASFQTPTLFLIAADLTKMQVDTNVSESDIGRVSVGNAASFTVESYPDRQFQGTVQQVRQAPQTVQNVVTYDVVVSVPNADLALKPGMTASMRIVTSRADHVLRVPDQALRFKPAESAAGGRSAAGGHGAPQQPGDAAGVNGASRGRAAHVWLLADGKARRIPITVGLDDDQFSQVVAGELHEGDQVIISERTGTPPRSQAMPSGLFPSRR